MSRRNLILLIITLSAILIAFFGYLYSIRITPENPSTPEGGASFLSRYNPFNTNTPTRSGGSVDENTDDTQTEEGVTIDLTVNKLERVSSMPIAGYNISQKEVLREIPQKEQIIEGELPLEPIFETVFLPMVRYVSREDGNIYQSFVDRISERRFSSTIIPKVYEAMFGRAGEVVIMRYIKNDEKTIETFVGTVSDTNTEDVTNNEIKGYFLPDNISDLSLSASGSNLFYLFNVGDNGIGINYDLKNERKTQVLSTPFSEWTSSWVGDRVVTLTTKPSSRVPGYMYSVDTNTKSLNRIFGGINGLTTLTGPDGKKVLYTDNLLNLYIYNTSSSTSTPLNIRTLPEKCVWSEDSVTVYCAVPQNITTGNFPDSWYKGLTSFTDSIWKVNTNTGDTSIVINPTEVGTRENFDAVKLDLDLEENYLMFVNKNDSYLWRLDLSVE